MQKSGPLNTYVDKRGLHTRQYAHHLTLINIANQATALIALYGNFLGHAVFYQGYASFHWRNIDKNFSAHGLFQFSVNTILGVWLLPNRYIKFF